VCRLLFRTIQDVTPILIINAKGVVHAPLAKQHEWYAALLRGHYGYYGRPHNYPALNGFYREVCRIWMRCLRRRSHNTNLQ